jgi:sulfite exporter TauE/SafE
LLIGLLHGAAGSGGLLVLVVAATHSIFEAFIYILVFAVGAIVGMALLSVVVSMPLSLAQASAGRVNKIVLTALAGFCFWTGSHLGFSSLTILGFINS